MCQNEESMALVVKGFWCMRLKKIKTWRVKVCTTNIVVFTSSLTFEFLADDMEVDSDGEGAADVDSATKIKKKAVRGPAENKSKKEHINVVFIGHVGGYQSSS